MKEANFQYKCRRCSNIYSDTSTAENTAFKTLINSVSETYGEPTTIDFFSVHCCKDGGKGVSDLIGYSVEGEK